jgi:hypothetical protein
VRTVCHEARSVFRLEQGGENSGKGNLSRGQTVTGGEIGEIGDVVDYRDEKRGQ